MQPFREAAFLLECGSLRGELAIQKAGRYCNQRQRGVRGDRLDRIGDGPSGLHGLSIRSIASILLFQVLLFDP